MKIFFLFKVPTMEWLNKVANELYGCEKGFSSLHFSFVKT